MNYLIFTLFFLSTLCPVHGASLHRRNHRQRHQQDEDDRRKSSGRDSGSATYQDCSKIRISQWMLSCVIEHDWAVLTDTCNGRTCKEVRVELCVYLWDPGKRCTRTKWRTVTDLKTSQTLSATPCSLLGPNGLGCALQSVKKSDSVKSWMGWLPSELKDYIGLVPQPYATTTQPSLTTMRTNTAPSLPVSPIQITESTTAEVAITSSESPKTSTVGSEMMTVAERKDHITTIPKITSSVATNLKTTASKRKSTQKASTVPGIVELVRTTTPVSQTGTTLSSEDLTSKRLPMSSTDAKTTRRELEGAAVLTASSIYVNDKRASGTTEPATENKIPIVETTMKQTTRPGVSIPRTTPTSKMVDTTPASSQPPSDMKSTVKNIPVRATSTVSIGPDFTAISKPTITTIAGSSMVSEDEITINGTTETSPMETTTISSTLPVKMATRSTSDDRASSSLIETSTSEPRPSQKINGVLTATTKAKFPAEASSSPARSSHWPPELSSTRPEIGTEKLGTSSLEPNHDATASEVKTIEFTETSASTQFIAADAGVSQGYRKTSDTVATRLLGSTESFMELSASEQPNISQDDTIEDVLFTKGTVSTNEEAEYTTMSSTQTSNREIVPKSTEPSTSTITNSLTNSNQDKKTLSTTSVRDSSVEELATMTSQLIPNRVSSKTTLSIEYEGTINNEVEIPTEMATGVLIRESETTTSETQTVMESTEFLTLDPAIPINGATSTIADLSKKELSGASVVPTDSQSSELFIASAVVPTTTLTPEDANAVDSFPQAAEESSTRSGTIYTTMGRPVSKSIDGRAAELVTLPMSELKDTLKPSTESTIASVVTDSKNYVSTSIPPTIVTEDEGLKNTSRTESTLEVETMNLTDHLKIAVVTEGSTTREVAAKTTQAAVLEMVSSSMSKIELVSMTTTAGDAEHTNDLTKETITSPGDTSRKDSAEASNVKSASTNTTDDLITTEAFQEHSSPALTDTATVPEIDTVVTKSSSTLDGTQTSTNSLIYTFGLESQTGLYTTEVQADSTTDSPSVSTIHTAATPTPASEQSRIDSGSSNFKETSTKTSVSEATTGTSNFDISTSTSFKEESSTTGTTDFPKVKLQTTPAITILTPTTSTDTPATRLVSVETEPVSIATSIGAGTIFPMMPTISEMDTVEWSSTHGSDTINIKSMATLEDRTVDELSIGATTIKSHISPEIDPDLASETANGPSADAEQNTNEMDKNQIQKGSTMYMGMSDSPILTMTPEESPIRTKLPTDQSSTETSGQHTSTSDLTSTETQSMSRTLGGIDDVTPIPTIHLPDRSIEMNSDAKTSTKPLQNLSTTEQTTIIANNSNHSAALSVFFSTISSVANQPITSAILPNTSLSEISLSTPVSEESTRSTKSSDVPQVVESTEANTSAIQDLLTLTEDSRVRSSKETFTETSDATELVTATSETQQLDEFGEPLADQSTTKNNPNTVHIVSSAVLSTTSLVPPISEFGNIGTKVSVADTSTFEIAEEANTGKISSSEIAEMLETEIAPTQIIEAKIPHKLSAVSATPTFESIQTTTGGVSSCNTPGEDESTSFESAHPLEQITMSTEATVRPSNTMMNEVSATEPMLIDITVLRNNMSDENEKSQTMTTESVADPFGLIGNTTALTEEMTSFTEPAATIEPETGSTKAVATNSSIAKFVTNTPSDSNSSETPIDITTNVTVPSSASDMQSSSTVTEHLKPSMVTGETVMTSPTDGSEAVSKIITTKATVLNQTISSIDTDRITHKDDPELSLTYGTETPATSDEDDRDIGDIQSNTTTNGITIASAQVDSISSSTDSITTSLAGPEEMMLTTEEAKRTTVPLSDSARAEETLYNIDESDSMITYPVEQTTLDQVVTEVATEYQVSDLESIAKSGAVSTGTSTETWASLEIDSTVEQQVPISNKPVTTTATAPEYASSTIAIIIELETPVVNKTDVKTIATQTHDNNNTFVAFNETTSIPEASTDVIRDRYQDATRSSGQGADTTNVSGDVLPSEAALNSDSSPHDYPSELVSPTTGGVQMTSVAQEGLSGTNPVQSTALSEDNMKKSAAPETRESELLSVTSSRTETITVSTIESYTVEQETKTTTGNETTIIESVQATSAVASTTESNILTTDIETGLTTELPTTSLEAHESPVSTLPASEAPGATGIGLPILSTHNLDRSSENQIEEGTLEDTSILPNCASDSCPDTNTAVEFDDRTTEPMEPEESASVGTRSPTINSLTVSDSASTTASFSSTTPNNDIAGYGRSTNNTPIPDTTRTTTITTTSSTVGTAPTTPFNAKTYKCKDKNGSYTHPTRLGFYIQCSNGRVYEMPCAPGTELFDEELQACI